MYLCSRYANELTTHPAVARSTSNMRFKNSRESAPESVASASLDLVRQ
jgi:hypothetical protein